MLAERMEGRRERWMERRTQLFINRANCMVHWGGNLNRGEQFYCKATEPPVGNTI